MIGMFNQLKKSRLSLAPYCTEYCFSTACGRRDWKPLPCTIRWCRAVDIPSSKPEFFKYKPTRKPSQFEPFSESDSHRLEQAFQNKTTTQVPVETDGLMTVDFVKRRCHPTFWDGSSYEVRRGTWFEQISSSKLFPLSEDDATMLENAYSQRNVVTLLTSGEEVLLDCSSDPPSAHSQDQSWASAIRKLEVPKHRKFIRGYYPESVKAAPRSELESLTKSGIRISKEMTPKKGADTGTPGARPSVISEAVKATTASNTDISLDQDRDDKKRAKIPVRPSFVPRKINHLLLCVHGIGQYVTHRYEFVNFVKDVDQFRGSLSNALQASTSLQEHLSENHGSDPTNTFTQALPILWRNSLPTSVHRPKDDPRFDALKPQALFGRENILADIVLDFIMYTEKNHRQAIINTTASLMNDAVRNFRKMRRNSSLESGVHDEDLKISVVGHSLGSVITNDLLRQEGLLDFDVENVFLMGSPVGVLDLVQGKRFNMDTMNAKHIYNILRQSDPVAARIEPLVNPLAVDVNPLALPGHGNSLIETLKDFGDELTARGAVISSGMQSFWGAVTRQFAGKSPLPPPVSPETMGGYLSEATSRIESTSDVSGYQSVAAYDSIKDKANISHKMLKGLRGFNRHGRLDFKVAEGVDLSLLVGIAGHFMYFDNQDIAGFILREIHRAPIELPPHATDEEENIEKKTA